MKIEHFEELLDQYGWDLTSWPEALRRDANILIANDPRAAELHRSLRAVEDLLADDPVLMGKHKAIDDIFDAIEASEQAAASDTVAVHVEEESPFQVLDDRPKSRRHVSAASAAPTGDGPARKTYPTTVSVSPTSSAIAKDSTNHAARKDGTIAWLGGRVFSLTGMAVCVLAGFVFGVTLTIEQGHQETATAEEAQLSELLERHVYSLEQLSPGAGSDVRLYQREADR